MPIYVAHLLAFTVFYSITSQLVIQPYKEVLYITDPLTYFAFQWKKCPGIAVLFFSNVFFQGAQLHLQKIPTGAMYRNQNIFGLTAVIRESRGRIKGAPGSQHSVISSPGAISEFVLGDRLLLIYDAPKSWTYIFTNPCKKA